MTDLVMRPGHGWRTSRRQNFYGSRDSRSFSKLGAISSGRPRPGIGALLLTCRAVLVLWLLATTAAGYAAGWRAATTAELSAALPARAPVVAERIETELRSASGVIDEQGRLIAGVVLITAGYSANGRYADYLLVQAPIKVADTVLPPGGYLLGWTRSADDLLVTISQAATGKALLQVSATRNESVHRVEQLRIWAAPRGMIQLGRFTFDYSIVGR